MSITLRDSQKKYILDWGVTMSNLVVYEYSYSTWNQSLQKYDMILTNTFTFGEGENTNIISGCRNEVMNPFPMGSFINFVSGSRNCLRQLGSYDVSSFVSGGRYSG